MSEQKKLSRRDFLRLTTLAGAGVTIAACAPQTPQVIEKTVVVKETVPVKETVQVKETVSVEKLVTPTLRPTPGKVSYIRFLTQETDAGEVAVYRKMMAEFEALNPDIRIELQLTGAESIMEKMITSLTSGVTAIDMVQPNPPLAFLLATKGYLEPIDDVVKELGGEDFFYSVFKTKGNVFAVPFGGGATTFWYRKDLFDADGLKAPTTYAELDEAAKHFTKKFNPKSPTEFGITLPLSKTQPTQFFAMPFIWNTGGEIFDKDLKVILDSPEAAKGLANYANLAQYTSEAAINYNWAEMINTFLSGQTAISMYLGRMLPRTYLNAPNLVGKVQAFMYPKDKLQVCHDDPNIYVISSKSPVKDACKKWLKFMMQSKLSNDFLCSVPGHLPPATKAQETWWAQDKTGCKELDENVDIKKLAASAQKVAYNMTLNSGGIVEAVKQGKTTFVATGAPNPFTTVLEGTDFFIPTMIQSVVLKKMTPEAAIKEVAPKIDVAVKAAMKEVGWGA